MRREGLGRAEKLAGKAGEAQAKDVLVCLAGTGPGCRFAVRGCSTTARRSMVKQEGVKP